MSAVLRESGGFEKALDRHVVAARAKPAKAHGRGWGALSAKTPYIGWGTLVGWQAIADYFGTHINTVTRWRKREGLPVCNLPDGRIVITLSLIDQWLMARREAQQGSQRQARTVKQQAKGIEQGQEEAQNTCEPLCVDASPEKASNGAGSSAV